jgi:hypothetical protein
MASCANNPFKKDNTVKDPTPDQTIKTKWDLYCELSKPSFNEKGFVHGECDGVLFTSLYAVACPNSGAKLEAFEYPDEPGRYSRDPQPEQCWSESEQRAKDGNPNRSPTTDSRDGVAGRFIYWWSTKDLAAIKRAINYLKNNDWYLCPPEGAKDQATRFSRCFVNPSLRATFYELAAHLGMDCDEGCKSARAVPQIFSGTEDGFELHLLVLSILIRGTVQGAINDNQVLLLKKAAQNNPGNALYLAVLHKFTDGDQTETLKLLGDEVVFPTETLPTSANYCTEYRYQRDQFKSGQANPDWLPCVDTQESKSGTDFSFAAKITLEDLD